LTDSLQFTHKVITCRSALGRESPLAKDRRPNH